MKTVPPISTPGQHSFGEYEVKTFVYQFRANEVVKIGFTFNVRSRLYSVQQELKEFGEFCLVGYVPGTLKDESYALTLGRRIEGCKCTEVFHADSVPAIWDIFPGRPCITELQTTETPESKQELEQIKIERAQYKRVNCLLKFPALEGTV